MTKITVLILSLCLFLKIDIVASQSLLAATNAVIENSGSKILLPIEVIGAEGSIEEIEFTISTDQYNQSKLLWLQVNNLGYQNKASIKINSSDWVDLNHVTTNIQSPEKERGGMVHGGHNTIRFTIKATGLKSGLNKISFRFNRR